MKTAEIVDRAGRLLADAAPPESKVILFGSRARGDADADSDFDFLVIEPSVAGKAKEMIRLRAALDPDASLSPPLSASDARALVPWAVDFRYDDLLEERLDRAASCAPSREMASTSQIAHHEVNP